MSQKNKVCIELTFSKTTSDSEARKVREFWKLIDSQNELQPYEVEKNVKSPKLSDKDDKSDYSSPIGENVENLENLSNCASAKNKRFWYDELRLFQALGLDKFALSTCKQTDFEASRKEDESLILSDMVDQSYEEVEADLKNFERRLNNKKPN
ncbi:uncharacterized protein LOC117180573 [Belonocnema kinseyi]|uniref:uncharacterized protein LOC117180573 n=1 Tax=Belonocnema kinseyi TaxID=2817044 RepID=UPI00143D0414|nr:uncharacterized protein LOC117180573 [Belonocnema kinseyi]